MKELKKDLKELIVVSLILAAVIIRGKIEDAIHWLHCRLWGIGVLLVGLLLAPLVFAQQTLNYTGQPMAGTNPALLITGQVVLAQPLAANGVQTVVPVSYSFTGNLPFNTNDGGVTTSPPTFTFVTQNGVITSWNIAVGLDWTGGYTSISITNAGDTYGDYLAAPDCYYRPTACQTLYSTSNATPGSWVDPPPAVDPLQAQVTTLQTQVASLQSQLSSTTVLEMAYKNGYVGWADDAAQYKAWLLEETAANAACQAELKKK